MCDKLRCEVVRDLLPNYIEGLTSVETNDTVFKHMEGCEECKKLHDKLKADMAVPKIEKKDLLRLLRALRKARLTQIILAVLGGAVLTWIVVFLMGSGFSVVSPREIHVQNIYRLSDGSMVVAYTVPGLDNKLLAGISGRQWGNGDWAFEIRTTFWNRLFGNPDPENSMLYYHVDFTRNLPIYYDGVTEHERDEPLIIYYGNERSKKELWRKGNPVIEATPEFELYINRGSRQNYEDFLWRLSVTEPAPTMIPGGASN